MSAAALQSETSATALSTAGRLGPLRVAGGVRASFVAGEGKSRVAKLCERDGYRMRFPRTGDGLEGVIINTGGGVAGGDEVAIALTAREATDVLVTTQSAERVYRALAGGRTRISISLIAEDDARLVWMPQETIVFNGAALERRLDADIADSAHLLIVEPIVLGRKAHGETLRSGNISDQWRMRRAGRLILAECLRLDGDIATKIARPGVAGGAHVLGTAVYVAPDAEDRLGSVRAALLSAGCRMAASAWEGMVVVRGLAAEAAPPRAAFAALVPLLMGRAEPRVWQT